MALTNTKNSSLLLDIWKHPKVYDFRTLFYLVTPQESTYETVEEVPKIVDNAVPYFMLLIIVEMLINIFSGHKERMPRFEDAFSSIAAGFVMGLPTMMMRNIELIMYVWVHEHYALWTLDWRSPWTWLIAMFGVDLGYYCVHRCAHEINFMWAAHQVHHSSEDYNLTTALRQSALQKYSSWLFYIPLAFFLPPSVFLTHIHFNLIYQFWIHTEIVDTVGPLEWVLNTPSHHRVHHGRNRYCIDRNYAGVFIIWDRMFGTFVKEEKKGEIAYGLVHPLSSWDVIYTQLCHWKYTLRTAYNMKGFQNKISCFLKGPGWAPSKPRLGVITDIPDIKGPVEKYSTSNPWFLHLYMLIHFISVFAGKEIHDSKQDLSPIFSFALMLYFVWCLTNIGYFYEHKPFAAISELMRCATYLIVDAYVYVGVESSNTALAGRMLMTVSMVAMLYICAKQSAKTTKTD